MNKVYKTISILLFFFFIGCSDEPETTTWVNLRQSPTTQGNNVIKVVPPKQKLNIITHSNNWVKVKIQETGEMGWIYKKYITKYSTSGINLFGMILTAALGTLFTYFMAALAVSLPGGEHGSFTAAGGTSSGLFFSLFIVTGYISGISIWKIVLSSFFSVISSFVGDAVVSQGEPNIRLTTFYFILGMLAGFLIVFMFGQNSLAITPILSTINMIQSALSIFE